MTERGEFIPNEINATGSCPEQHLESTKLLKARKKLLERKLEKVLNEEMVFINRNS